MGFRKKCAVACTFMHAAFTFMCTVCTVHMYSVLCIIIFIHSTRQHCLRCVSYDKISLPSSPCMNVLFRVCATRGTISIQTRGRRKSYSCVPPVILRVTTGEGKTSSQKIFHGFFDRFWTFLKQADDQVLKRFVFFIAANSAIFLD